MGRHATVVLICDICGVEGDGVETRQLAVLGKAFEAENCDKCWAKILAQLGGWAKTAREVKPKRPRVPKAVAWPDTPWQFTHHAMQRMGERQLTPSEVLYTIEHPDVTRPGQQPEHEIRQRNGVKAVVIPDRLIVITAAHTEADDPQPVGD